MESNIIPKIFEKPRYYKNTSASESRYIIIVPINDITSDIPVKNNINNINNITRS